MARIDWSPHGHRRSSEGSVGDKVVVKIHKHKNHTHTNDGIYSVFLMGQEMPVTFRHINDARAAAQRAYDQG